MDLRGLEPLTSALRSKRVGCNEAQPRADTTAARSAGEPLRPSEQPLQAGHAQTRAQTPVGEVVALPPGEASVLDLVRAADDAIVRGDLHAARRLLAALAEQLDVAAGDEQVSSDR